MSLSVQLKYVTTASRMYYVDVNRLRTLWNCCGLVSVQRTQPFDGYIIHTRRSGYILQLQ